KSRKHSTLANVHQRGSRLPRSALFRWSGVAIAVAATGTWDGGPARAQTAAAPPQDAALRSFEVVRAVFQHPRCQNCHIPGDAPLQYDQGRTHAQNVMRGPRGHGVVAMECAACHHDENLPASYGDHAPPGAPNWHLPPPETKMVFIGLSPRELCQVIKDRGATG